MKFFRGGGKINTYNLGLLKAGEKAIFAPGTWNYDFKGNKNR